FLCHAVIPLEYQADQAPTRLKSSGRRFRSCQSAAPGANPDGTTAPTVPGGKHLLPRGGSTGIGTLLLLLFRHQSNPVESGITDLVDYVDHSPVIDGVSALDINDPLAIRLVL